MDRMCYFYLYDRCKYGEKCDNRHSFNRRAVCFKQRNLTKNLVDDITLMKLVRLSECKYAIKFCSNGKCDGSCDNLHCCKYQMTGRQCNNSKDTCDHGHAVYESKGDHNYELLASRDLQDVNELELRSYIHDAYYCVKSKLQILGRASSSTSMNTQEQIDCKHGNQKKGGARAKNTVSFDATASNSCDLSQRVVEQCVLCKGTDMLQKIPDASCDCQYCFVCFFKVKFESKCKIHDN